MLYVFGILLGAVILDFHCWKVPNAYIILCSITGMYLLWIEYGIWGYGIFLGRFLGAIASCYVFYLLGAMGAGDVKLLGVLAGLITVKGSVWIVISAMVLGAAWGLLRYVIKGELSIKAAAFVNAVRNFSFQNTKFNDFHQRKQGEKIHFTLCILLAYVGWMYKEGAI